MDSDETSPDYFCRSWAFSGSDADRKCSEYHDKPPELVIKREELRRLVEARDAIEEWAANSV